MKKTFLFLILSLSLFSATARLFSVSATLNGANVVPANASTATGTLTGTFNDATNILSWTIPYMNLSSSMTGYGLHIAGVNGPAFFNSLISIASPISGSSFLLDNTLITALFNGNIYVDIYTTNFQNGEIRGKLALGMEIFSSSTQNTFYGIGGYAHTDGSIPANSHPSPFVRSGPSSQNDFMYVASTPDGSPLWGNTYGELTTQTSNRPITLTFKGNNVRKLGLNLYEEDINDNFTGGSLTATVTTNLGNSTSLTSTDVSRFVGFNVINENEYIVSATFSANVGFYTALTGILFGDNTPQNVALNFDGVDDFVQIPNTVGNFATNDNFTVSCWVKPNPTQTDLNSTFNRIIDKSSGFSGFPFTIRYYNQSAGADAGKVYIARYGGGFNISSLTSSVAINDGNWHHVAMVRSSSPATITVYIDGVASGSFADITSGTTTNTTPLFIGHGDGNFNRFKGEIDEVRIWNIAKTATQIAEERFCKTLTNTTNLQASYNFSNGVPHDNNPLITQIQDAVSTNHGTLNNFAKTGDASNFVTGQVKYVKKDATGSNNGSSWTNAFLDLQSALTANTCNDLFDVWVAGGTYKPAVSDFAVSFNIPSGMSFYGGFAGTEKSINQRNRALILTTNETTLSGDLSGNDILSNFTQNRTDNSKRVINIDSKSNIFIDGFSIRGGFGEDEGGGIYAPESENIRINNCKIFDNSANFGGGIGAGNANNLLISNTCLLGNVANIDGEAINFNSYSGPKNMKLNNTVVAGHVGIAILAISSFPIKHSYTNCTFANNGTAIFNKLVSRSMLDLTLKNCIMYGNNTGISVLNDRSIYTENITYSLVQGITTGTGNLDGNTTNPQFVNLTYTDPNNAGDYRLKWCSKAIDAGNNAGISPSDLDRKPRNFNGTADMGAYEFLGNTPSQAATSNITGTIDSPTYAGGAIQTITSTAKILAPAGAIDFIAPNSITLNPGFEARGLGNYFKAEIGLNTSCINN